MNKPLTHQFSRSNINLTSLDVQTFLFKPFKTLISRSFKFLEVFWSFSCIIISSFSCKKKNTKTNFKKLNRNKRAI